MTCKQMQLRKYQQTYWAEGQMLLP